MSNKNPSTYETHYSLLHNYSLLAIIITGSHTRNPHESRTIAREKYLSSVRVGCIHFNLSVFKCLAGEKFARITRRTRKVKKPGALSAKLSKVALSSRNYIYGSRRMDSFHLLPLIGSGLVYSASRSGEASTCAVSTRARACAPARQRHFEYFV